MTLYVVLTISLRKSGSAESNDLMETQDEDRTFDPARRAAPRLVQQVTWGMVW